MQLKSKRKKKKDLLAITFVTVAERPYSCELNVINLPNTFHVVICPVGEKVASADWLFCFSPVLRSSLPNERAAGL